VGKNKNLISITLIDKNCMLKSKIDKLKKILACSQVKYFKSSQWTLK
jgi:hypothetical protein